jgi:hypothetical protein
VCTDVFTMHLVRRKASRDLLNWMRFRQHNVKIRSTVGIRGSALCTPPSSPHENRTFRQNSPTSFGSHIL